MKELKDIVEVILFVVAIGFFFSIGVWLFIACYTLLGLAIMTSGIL